MDQKEIIKVALVDDHSLFRAGLVELINGFQQYKIYLEANNGKEFVEKINHGKLPDLVLLDITMPFMNGFETAEWLKSSHPDIKVLALSMYDDDDSILKMFRAGAKGYILKDCEPMELRTAMHDVVKKGFYYSDFITNSIISNINIKENKSLLSQHLQPNERELKFLNLVCTELTYKEIADKMCLSARTIDGYRENLFEKFQVKSRTGLVLYALKNGIVKI